MNGNWIEEEWKQWREKTVYHCGKTMNDMLASVAVKHQDLVRRLHGKYGIAKEESKRQDDEFKIIAEQLKESNSNLIEAQKMRLK